MQALPELTSPPTRASAPSIMADSHRSRAHLLELPSEIRNAIYGLVYDMDAPPETVPCSESSPPSVNSILASRQLHAEMKQMYLTAFRHYFEKNKFKMVYHRNDHDGDDDYEQLQRIKSRDLARVQRFSFECHVTSEIHYSIDVTYEHDKWAAVLAWEAEGPDLNADSSLRHQEAIGVVRGLSKMLKDFTEFRTRTSFDPTVGKGMTAWNIRYLNPGIRFYRR